MKSLRLFWNQSEIDGEKPLKYKRINQIWRELPGSFQFVGLSRRFTIKLLKNGKLQLTGFPGDEVSIVLIPLLSKLLV